MADLVFDQKNVLFSSEDSNVHGFINSVREFGDNVSDVVEDIVGFFEYTKFLLQATADPIALLLLPTIDSLIAYLEDLKNIGAGTLAVWPWEAGTLPPQVDTSKLEQGLDAMVKFISSDSQTDETGLNFSNATLQWDPSKGYSLLENPSKNDSQLVATDDKVFTPETLKSTNLNSKSRWIELASAIRTFLNPQEWDGEITKEIAELIEDVSYFLNKRELTPQQVLDIIKKSFEDNSDPNKPTGTGTYTSLIILFALPSFSAFNEVLTAFYNYFGGLMIRGFEEAKEATNSDNRFHKIELGDPVRLTGLKTKDEIQDEINEKVTEFNQLQSDLNALLQQDTENTGAWSTTTFDSISQLYDILQKQGEIEDLREELQDYIEDIDVTSKVFFTNDVTLRNISKVPDGKYNGNDDNLPIPMFKTGDIVVQGNYVSNFTAKVENHVLHIEKGQVIKNTLKVKNVRGDIVKNYSTKGTASGGVIRKKGFDKETAEKINSNGLAALNEMKKLPLFAPPDVETPVSERTPFPFIATIREDDPVLTNVLPDPLSLYGVAGKDKLREFIKFNRKYKNDTAYSNDTSLFNDNEFQSLMLNFLKSLNVGFQVDHDFLNSDDISPSDESKKLVGNLSKKELLSLIPGLGVNFHIAKIELRDPNNIDIVNPVERSVELDDLFIKNESEVSKFKYIGMRNIEITLGQLKSDGTVETGSLLDNFIDAPNGEVPYWDYDNRKQPFNVLNVKSGQKPNWSYVRIQDFLPVYGETIDQVIAFTRRIRGWVTWVIDKIDELIQMLNDEIQALIQFNEKLQALLQLLTEGFNSAGMYSVAFSGEGGVPNFKSRLSSAKFLQKRVNPFPTVELGIVKEERQVENPVTGLIETITVSTLKPTIEKPDDEDKTEPELLSPSDLDSLKYCGAVVFYAQGNDSSKLDAFLQNFGFLETFASSLYSNLTGGDGIAEKLKPFVKEVQIQRSSDGQFVNCETEEAIPNTKIRIVITNEAHTLTEEERTKLSEIQGRSVDFSPRLLTSAISTTVSEDGVTLNTSDDVFVVRLGTTAYIELTQAFPTKLETIIDGETERQEFYIDLQPLTDLAATRIGGQTYQVEIKDSLLSYEKLRLKDSFSTSAGFSVEQTILEEVELIDAF